MSGLPQKLEVRSGHDLSLRALDPADMLDLIEAGGSAVSGPSASAWLSYAQMICSVSAINGVPVQMPATKDEIKDLARRIGNDGLSALQEVFVADASAGDGMLDTSKN
ncbi:hypothetical protein [Asaia krungthepensis]|uniref:Uncharacterized protein n=1 Tax=Asaia krungthepensis NRIC 0535 TaxID=1307925 RepID=A0ABQ0Q2I5_9PROT|nr:hypothetical protein [Asaia krungthepensis]GBQ88294.1 hypothetical protein AA0535_1506 [Asaia krungthepensis NRIC 0535]